MESCTEIQIQRRNNDIVTISYNADTQGSRDMFKTAGRIYRKTGFQQDGPIIGYRPLKDESRELTMSTRVWIYAGFRAVINLRDPKGSVSIRGG